MKARTLIEALIGIVIGVALYPVVQSTVGNASATGTNATLLNLIPLLYIIVIVAGVAAYVYLKS